LSNVVETGSRKISHPSRGKGSLVRRREGRRNFNETKKREKDRGFLQEGNPRKRRVDSLMGPLSPFQKSLAGPGFPNSEENGFFKKVKNWS